MSGRGNPELESKHSLNPKDNYCLYPLRKGAPRLIELNYHWDRFPAPGSTVSTGSGGPRMSDQEADHCEFDQPLHYSLWLLWSRALFLFFLFLGPVVYDIAND